MVCMCAFRMQVTCIIGLVLSVLAGSEGAPLKAPPGFAVKLFARGVNSSRQLAVSGNSKARGPWYIYSGSNKGPNLALVIDRNGDGVADVVRPIIRGLEMPAGVAWYKGALYVSGNLKGKGYVWRVDNIDSYAESGKEVPMSAMKVITDRLPSIVWHGRRYLRFHPRDPGQLYFGVGSPCDHCETPPSPNGIQFATIYKLDVASGQLSLVARGVRNTVGLDWHPRTGQLWFTDTGRDRMGEDLPDCELNVLTKPLQHFGYPWCHSVGSGDPMQRSPGVSRLVLDPNVNKDGKAFDCKGATLAAQPMGPHVTPLGMTFYRPPPGNPASLFPAQYHNQLFIAQRGSWNRKRKIGYNIAFVGLDAAGARAVRHEVFASGWLDEAKQSASGRPVDVTQLPDGSLLMSDDDKNLVYRIYYSK